MNIMIFGLFLVTFCVYGDAFKTAEKSLSQGNGIITSPLRTGLQKSLFADECDKDYLQCIEDQILYCTPAGYDRLQPCYYIVSNGNKGYCNCDKNDCVDSPPADCNVTRTCYNPGMKLPVQSDCNLYSYCDENNVESVYACPKGWVYNPRSQKCESSGPCETVKCDLWVTSSYYIPFPQAPEYYLFCGLFDEDYMRVSKCKQPGYAAERTGCKFLCSKDGIFQDPNPQRCLDGYYYVCTKVNGTFVKEERQCAPGTYFDNRLEMCSKTLKCPGSEFMQTS